jgi:predicted site-specific integrase-resolvase
MEDNHGNGSNFVRYMTNPRAFTLRKWFYDLLKLKYAEHDQIIERVASSLVTEKDIQDFSKLIGQVFEEGFRRAVEQYREQLEQMGLKISIVTPKVENSS